jgi:hypothetical protein
VSISLHGPSAPTNFPASDYAQDNVSSSTRLAGLTREELQRTLGVRPMDKSSRYRGVSRKKGKWEAKVILNNKWAFRGEGWGCCWVMLLSRTAAGSCCCSVMLLGHAAIDC